MEHDRGNPGGDERVVVGVVGDLPIEHEFELCGGIGLEAGHPQPLGGPRPEHLEPLASQPADHVEVHGEYDSGRRQHRRPHAQEVVGAEQSLLLAVPEGDQDRPPRRAGEMTEGLDQLQQSGDARGVVVGAVVDEARGTVAVPRVAVADVVVVGADHDDFLGDRGVAARQERQDVAHAAEVLEERALVAGGLNGEFLERRDDVGAGGPATAAASLPPLEGVVGQRVNVTARLVGPDARAGGRQVFRVARIAPCLERDGEAGYRQPAYGGTGCVVAKKCLHDGSPPCGTGIWRQE